MPVCAALLPTPILPYGPRKVSHNVYLADTFEHDSIKTPTFMESTSSFSAARLSSMTFGQSPRFLWQNARLVSSAAAAGSTGVSCDV